MATVPFHLTATDRATLSMTDEEFVPYTWTDLKNAIAAKDLSTIPRSPSILRRYIEWSREITTKHGSTAEFLLHNRLFWNSTESSQANGQPNGQIIIRSNATPFADKTDYKIIYNDWPYGLASDITHLVVWMKTRLPVNKAGEMTPESRASVEDFIDRTFVQEMRKANATNDNVIYFKNVPKLQSVGAVEHFHVLIRGAKSEALDEWTQGDVPIYRR
ncbi:hypothetical protein BKA65DRAFT_608686 [Rhexocercosporidium sp. MPI-PUGE-AT-0058]|nr:hypothetical protein BKA65DRAFT_608686 [Rhexocercosporidium sp. MPI-PUGE-AT-0058]